MCHLRQVCNTYLLCGHRESLPDELIQCDEKNCRFSPAHPRNCVLPRCRETCVQYRVFPEQYSPIINNLCPPCQEAANANARGRHRR